MPSVTLDPLCRALLRNWLRLRAESGEVALDDPISFSGTICFTDGMTDAAAFFGYFNRANQVEKFDKTRSDAFSPVANTMGVAIADSSAVGYYFTPQVTSTGREVVRTEAKGTITLPTSDLPAGLYTVTSLQNGERSQRLIMIMR